MPDAITEPPVPPVDDKTPAPTGDGKGTPDPAKTAPAAPTSTPEAVKVQVPEGIDIEPEILKGITEGAKDSASAQRLVDSLVGANKKAQESYEKAKQEWDKELRADAEYGGAKYADSDKAAQSFLARFVKQDEVPFLNESGLISHPVIRKIMARVGAAIKEDSVAVPNAHDRTAPRNPNDAFKMIYKDEQAKANKEQ